MVLWHHVILHDVLVGFPSHSPLGGGPCPPHGQREITGFCPDAGINLFAHWGF